jgi:anti-anti-sigma factor
MQISTRTINDIHIVAISGSLDSTTYPEAQKSLDAVVAGAKKVALDFSGLDYISSAGLRVLLGVAKKLRATGGTLGMFGLNQSVREVFEISGFSSILSVYQSEAEAVGAM